MTKSIKLDLAKIRIDGGTQSRVEINQRIVEEYCDALDNGDVFPPLDVFHDGTDYWLADGFHRLQAFKTRKIKRCDCIAHQGGQRAAILWSVGANGKHGLRRSNDDKRKAVMTLLGDQEWSKWSNRVIADRCGVDESTVRKYRDEINPVTPGLTAGIPQSRMGADGRVIDTANIGKQPEKPVADQPPATTDKPADSANPTVSLNPLKWYAVDIDTQEIVDDPFESKWALDHDERYASKFPMRGDKLKSLPVYTKFKLAPAFPKPSDPPAEPNRTLADLDPAKLYPVKLLANLIAFDPFDSVGTFALSPRYPIPWSPVRGQDLQTKPQYEFFKIVPPEPKVRITPPASATARTYPLPIHGNVQAEKFYPVSRIASEVFDEAFDDHKSCQECPRYPGNRPMRGLALDHDPVFRLYQLVAPKTASASSGATAPGCRMIYYPSETLEGYAPGFWEKFVLDADYWGELARMNELPASTEPTRILFAADRFYPVDDKNRLIYHDPRLTSDIIHSPYRGISGHDLNHAPAFKEYRCVDADLPCPVIPAASRPLEAPRPAAAPAKANNHGLEDAKWYPYDPFGRTIKNAPFDSYDKAQADLRFKGYGFVQGVHLNERDQYRSCKVESAAPSAPNGNGASKPTNTPFIDRSNTFKGKDTPVSAHEAHAISIAQQRRDEALKALDFRDLADKVLGLDEAALKRLSKPLEAVVLNFLLLGTGNIDSKTFGVALGPQVAAVSPKVSQPITA